jgi:hypothetical protein
MLPTTMLLRELHRVLAVSHIEMDKTMQETREVPPVAN